MPAVAPRIPFLPAVTGRSAMGPLRVALLFAVGLGFISSARAQAPPAAKCPPSARTDSVQETYGTAIVPGPSWVPEYGSADNLEQFRDLYK